MNLVDLFIAIGIAWAAFKGWRRGLVVSLVGLAGLVLAYGLSLSWGGTVARGMAGADAEPGTGLSLLGFVLVFLLVTVAAYVAGISLRKILQTSPLGIVDTVGGIAVGGTKAVLVLGLLMILLRSLPLPGGMATSFDSSLLGEPVERSAIALLDGIQVVFPQAAKLYHRIVPQRANDPANPVVDEASQKAEKARERLKGLIDESRQRLESK